MRHFILTRWIGMEGDVGGGRFLYETENPPRAWATTARGILGDQIPVSYWTQYEGGRWIHHSSPSPFDDPKNRLLDIKAWVITENEAIMLLFDGDSK